MVFAHPNEREENFNSLNVEKHRLDYGPLFKIDGVSKIKCFKCKTFADIRRNLHLISIVCPNCKTVHQMKPDDGIEYVRRKMKMNQQKFEIIPSVQYVNYVIDFAKMIKEKHEDITYGAFVAIIKKAYPDINYDIINKKIEPIYYGDELLSKSQSPNSDKNKNEE